MLTAQCDRFWDSPPDLGVLLMYNLDFSYVKMQGTTFAFAELACGLIISCLFVLPRLYRALTGSPPYDSEEHRLRKWKKLASTSGKDDSRYPKFHRKEEERNPWERDIEASDALPDPLLQPKE